MPPKQSTFRETSVIVGIAFTTIGLGLWGTNFAFSLFTSWVWAALIGGWWVLVGASLLFPDVRLYQGEQATTGEYLAVDE